MQRVRSASLMLPPVLALVYFSPPLVFLLLVCAIITFALHEFYQMLATRGSTPHRWAGWVLGNLIAVSVFTRWTEGYLLLLTLSPVVLLVSHLGSRRKVEAAIPDVGGTLLGVFYVALLLSYFIRLRSFPAGVAYVFFVLLVTWGADTAAYYIGRGLGRRPIAPRTSPGKTWEGTLGSFAGALVAAAFWYLLFRPTLAPAHLVAMAWIAAASGFLGDLAESLVKRSAGVKDAGRLLPGHGGLLDRIDSLMLVAPALYYYTAYLVVRADHP